MYLSTCRHVRLEQHFAVLQSCTLLSLSLLAVLCTHYGGNETEHSDSVAIGLVILCATFAVSQTRQLNTAYQPRQVASKCSQHANPTHDRGKFKQQLQVATVSCEVADSGGRTC